MDAAEEAIVWKATSFSVTCSELWVSKYTLLVCESVYEKMVFLMVDISAGEFSCTLTTVKLLVANHT